VLVKELQQERKARKAAEERLKEAMEEIFEGAEQLVRRQAAAIANRKRLLGS
jgi:hypothetical protein